MNLNIATNRTWLLAILVVFTLIASACNLGAPESDQVEITSAPTNTDAAPTRTLLPTGSASTAVSVTSIPLPTQRQLQPTQVVQLPPTTNPIPIPTDLPTSILILSPLPNNVISGNTQILGSAIHPEFLQYRVEFGPDPNPGNLWFPITGVVQTTVLNSVLGVWNTTTSAVPDGTYQIRLRVFLRDGSEQSTVVNNIRVQNQAPTPIPTSTPNIPRPIAGFTQDITSGDTPLVVQFTNLSQGQIETFSWNFGDGGNSNQRNPSHTFSTPGLYTVRLRVIGPGGESNVTRQINVTSPSAPIANFTVSNNSGEAPLTVNFTNTTTGNASEFTWNFGDNSDTVNQTSPTHTFTEVGTYNVILEAKGPGGQTTSVRQVTVTNPQVPAPVAGFDMSTQTGEVPLTLQLTNTSTGNIETYLWDFDGDNITDSILESPTTTITTPGEYQIRLIVIGPGGQNETTQTVTAVNPPDAPVASFTTSTVSGDAPLAVSFTNTTSGDATSYAWDFNGDGQTDETAVSPSFTFNDPGTYTITLTATGPGGSTTATEVISVTAPLAPPVADFGAAPLIGEVPLTVNFTNTSVGSEMTFAWDFETDGVVDNNDNSPSYEYTAAGSYTVTLTVTNAAGTDTKTETVNVSETVVQQPPTAAFSANPVSGTAPLTVTFTDLSIGDVSGHQWDFQNDGIVDDTSASPTFTYDTSGDFTAKLTVTGPGGTSEITSLISVLNPVTAPVAGFSATPTDLSVAFITTASGDNLTYLWDFGDGTTSTDPNPTHVYAVAGTYNVIQTVTNSGGSNAITQPVTTTDPVTAPVAGFSATPTNLTAAFTFTGSGDNLAYEWNFGDTNISTDPNPTHVYAVAGTYSVTLTVSNSTGANSITQEVTVTNPIAAPVAGFSATPTNLTAAFTFTGSGDNLAYEWNFGDTNISTDPNPTHVYAVAGTYSVTLTVSNSVGANSITQEVTVTDPVAAPIAGFSATPTNLSVALTSTASGDNLTYLWDFGDGNSSTDPNPTHVYAVAGTYNVTQTVTNAGGSNAITQPVTVTDPVAAPIAGFSATPTNLSVALTSTASGDNLTYLWDFGDGNSSTDPNPTHVYAVAGTYNVTQTVTNAGGSNAITQPVTVTDPVAAPIAGFSATPTNLSVALTSTASGDNLTYLWDFGDSNSSTDPNPTHVYAVAGTYNVTQTVTNAGGSNAITQPVTVTDPVAAPIAGFSATPTDLSVAFTSTASGDNLTYLWDFGDGSITSTEPNPTHAYSVAGTYNVTQTVTNAGGSNTITQPVTVTEPAQQPTLPTGDIVFTSNRDGNNEIYVMNTDGTEPVNVTSNGANDRHPSWSPDGSRIVFTSDRDNGTNDIYIVAIDTLNVTRLTSDSGNNSQPVWSPDGNKIAFTSDRTGDNDLFVMNADGSEQTQLTTDTASESDATWSPDSNSLAFVSDVSGNRDIYVINANDGTAIITLTTDGSDDFNPSWLNRNDASLLAFTSTRSGDEDIWLINPVDASGLTQTTFDNSRETQPEWSQDGNFIIFVSDRDDNGANNIYTMTPDGNNVVRITPDVSNDRQADWK